MSFTIPDETLQKPRKRTGVWSVDTMQQKSSLGANQKRFPRKNTAEISLTGEDDELSTLNLSNSRTCDDIPSNRCVNWNSLGLPALNKLNDVSISGLLNEFNNPDDVKEGDSPWTKDLLLADITNKLDENPVRA